MVEWWVIFFQAALVNNVVLIRMLGVDAAVAPRFDYRSAIELGLTLMIIMPIASAVTWLIQKGILLPLHAEFLQLLIFVITMVILIPTILRVLGTYSPKLRDRLLPYFGSMVMNGAVLGGLLLVGQSQYNFIEAIGFGLGGGCGVMLVLFMMAGIQERLAEAEIPKYFQGYPILFIAAGMLALSFSVFSFF
ncbi:Rnf-Nqr domain containing protein [Candidatus Magnetaquicoccus inordinatus]|uniref:Rnf-Nqr domain containing protein n=1 Tax=Candidatus Magnetaquicoccus inordinatus TaxID=2496818 RepID=UPI00102B2B34|nr:Rnf-Nqr domain containing protein [Candidatus Magnetaquicoccus inordinatus]